MITESRRLLVAAAAALLCGACAGVDVPTSPAPSPTHRLQAEPFQASVDGSELRGRVVSAQAPELTLLTLHGGPGVASTYMRDLEGMAEDGYAVVTYDQRGVGRSDLPSMDFSMQAYVSDIRAVQAEVPGRTPVLFGHSWGGLLAMNYAAVHPDRIAGLVLFGSAPPTRSALSQAGRRFDRRLDRLQEQGVVPEPVPSDEGYLRAIQPVYFSDPSFPLPPALQELDFSPAVNRRTWAALGDYNFRSRLSEIEHPVLFFYGEDDPFGEAMAEATLEALTSAQLEVVWLDNCGHYWFECQLVFETPLYAFLERVASDQQVGSGTSGFD